MPRFYVAKYNRYSPVTVILNFLFRHSTYRSTSIFHIVYSEQKYIFNNNRHRWKTHLTFHQTQNHDNGRLIQEKTARHDYEWTRIQSKDAEWRFFRNVFDIYSAESLLVIYNFILTRCKIMPLINLFKQIVYDISVFEIMVRAFLNS